MPRDPKVVAKEYIDRLLAKIPEDKRADVAAHLGKEDVLEEFGKPIVEVENAVEWVNAESTRVAADKKNTETYRDTLNKWFIDNADTLAKGSAALEALEKGEGAATPPAGSITSPQAPDLSKYMTKEEASRGLADLLAQKDQWNGYVMAKVPALVIEHYDRYHEKLNPQELFAHAGKMRTNDLDQAYLDLTKEKRAAADKKADDARIDKAVQDRLKEERAKLNMPYPSPEGVEPSTISGLKSKDGKADYGVEAAVRDYYQSQADARTH
jgi:hypothetical protein